MLVKVLVAEEDSDVAEAFFDAHLGRLAGPTLLEAEVANAVRFTKGLPSPEARTTTWGRFAGLRVILHAPHPGDMDEAFRFSLTTATTVYDALYLVTARRLGGRLVTADARFATKARRNDVTLLRDWEAGEGA